MNFRRVVHFLLLVAVPVAALSFFSPLEKWRGPAYLVSNLDPNYAYLFNSLNILNGIPPGHRDHPGTPVQTWGGLTLRVKYPSDTRAEITERVLKDPEAAMSSLSFSLAALCTLVMILAGVVAAAAFGSVWAGLAFQLFPMVTPFYWDFLVKMTPDLLSMNLACLFLALCCRYYFTGEIGSKQARILGIVFGIAVASKVTAIPVILIPLYLCWKSRKVVLTLLGAGALTFLVCIIPILRKGAGYFLVWNYQLLTHSGNYGGGEAGLPSFSVWSASALNLLTSVWMYPAVIALGLVLVTRLKENSKKKFVVLSLVLLFVQLAIVAKHPAGRYLMPAFSACAVILAMGVTQLKRSWQAVTVCGLLAVFAFSHPLARARDQQKILVRSAAQGLLQVEIQRQDCRTVVSFSNASSKIYGLFFGDSFARGSYAASLDRLYPEALVYDLAQSRFYRFDVAAPTSVDELIKDHGPVCLLGPDDTSKFVKLQEPYSLKLLYSTPGQDALFSLQKPSSLVKKSF